MFSPINSFLKQECIPVGCVPATRRPYAGVCFPGEVPGRGGSAWSGGGGLPGPGGCLPGPGGSTWSGGCLPGPGGVCLVQGLSAWSGGCLLSPGVSAWSWGGVSQHALRQTPSPLSPPPVDRILDTRLWKYYLGPTSLRPVTINVRKITYLIWNPGTFFIIFFLSVNISFAMVWRAEYISLPVEGMLSAGSMNPWAPVSRNSTVYEYLIPATPFAQSSEPPDAKSKGRNSIFSIIINCRHKINCS